MHISKIVTKNKSSRTLIIVIVKFLFHFYPMGAGASIDQAKVEIQKPLDASDLQDDKQHMLSEVARLRQTIASATTPILPDWERVFDPINSCSYYYHMPSGVVQWEIPALKSPAAAARAPTAPLPTPSLSSFATSHKLFAHKLTTASKGVIANIRRQQVLWEHDWHNQLLDYSAELKKELEVQRREDDKNIESNNKKYAKLTTSTNERAENAEREAAKNAAETAQAALKKREDRHAKLMAKLAKKKKKHAQEMGEKQTSHSELLLKMNTTFKSQLGVHAKTLQAASKFLKGDDDEIIQDQDQNVLGGWVQLWDEEERNCYYWHPEKGSTWERPEDMEFNLHLKSLLNSEMKDIVQSLDTNLALEKWIADNEVSTAVLEDEKLETEIAEMEDELEKRRMTKHGNGVHELLASCTNSAE